MHAKLTLDDADEAAETAIYREMLSISLEHGQINAQRIAALERQVAALRLEIRRYTAQQVG